MWSDGDVPDPATTQATFCATLVDEWVRAGVGHAVVAPGSRSTPMALALAARPELTVHVHHDERCAAFTALGIGLATGAAAVLLCTSGTAATHFHGAVVESHQAGVPLLVVTADRPPSCATSAPPRPSTRRTSTAAPCAGSTTPVSPTRRPAAHGGRSGRGRWSRAVG